MEGSASPRPARHAARSGPQGPGHAALWAAGGTLTLACVAVPAVSAVGAMVEALWVKPAAATPHARLLAGSALWAACIATLSTCTAWPAAWAARQRGWSVLALLLVAALMPPYLAYTGWGLLRAPGTWLGDWLARAGQGGAAWAPVWFGRGLAVVGLGLWAAPLAALVMTPSVLAVDASSLDQARLDAPRRRDRWLLALRLSAGGVARAWALVWLVALGSAVPLHLAQVETAALGVWRALDGFGTLSAGSAVLSAWPVLAAGAGGAWLLARAAWDPVPVSWGGERERASTWAWWLSLALVGVAALGPVLLFAWSLRSFSSLGVFWRVSGREVEGSLGVAGLVVGASLVLALAGWSASRARAGWVRGLAGVSLGLWLLGALTPGVIVGRAVLWSWGWADRLADSPVIVAMAHLARFGAVPALMGLWLGRTEAPELAWIRALDGAGKLWAWWQTAGPARLAAACGSALAAGALSLHEIEASVFVQPPGLGSLPRTMLQHLHYNRTEDLSAAGLWVVGTGLAAALGVALAGWAASRWR